MKTRVYWDTDSINRMITLMMEAVYTSETSVYSEATWRYIPEGSILHTRRRENQKFHIPINCLHICNSFTFLCFPPGT
jgi:hypothetical protein